MDEKQILELIAGVSPEQLPELAKAVEKYHGVHGIRAIEDLWNDIHAIPPVAETKTGPTMISSGAGAELGIKNYSNPAKQVGLTQEYAELLHQDLEGWQSAAKSMVEKLDAIMGSFTEGMEKFGKSLVLKKDEEEKKEEKKDEMPKAPEPKKEDDEEKKSGMYCSDVNTLWDALGELEAAFAKAEEHDEKKDVEGLEEAREHIEKAEQHLEEVEAHEKKEMASKALIKAEVAINLGWRALLKASKLGGYGLHGYGNQEDAQVSGDSTSDNSKHDLKKAEAKATYWALKADRLRKANGLKPLRKDEEEKEKKDEMDKSAEPAATTAPAVAAPVVDNTQVDALKAEVDKANATIKAMQTRVDEVNQRIASVTGVKLPPMTSVMIKSEEDLSQLNARIEQAVESGALDAGDADTCQSLGQQFMAASKGYITETMVKQRLDHASPEVQLFFGVSGK